MSICNVISRTVPLVTSLISNPVINTRMDAIRNAIVRADGWFWHLSNVIGGVAILLGAVLYASPGTHSWNLIIVGVDPFYLLVPLSLFLMCVGGLDLWRWYESDEIL